MAPRRVKDKTRKPKQTHPARVKDPMSSSHTVFLKDHQEFEVFLSEGHPYFDNGCTVVPKGDHIKLKAVRSAKGGRIYTFQQAGELENWSRVSTTFLGEVLFNNPGQKTSSRICAFLEASNPLKTNIVTVVNPQESTVKIQPYQILEVVVYNPVWGMPLYWEADVTEDPRFEVLAHSYIQPHQYNPGGAVRKINDAFFTYPRALQASSQPFLEYHFWIRCNQQAAKHMMSLPNGYFPNGKIRFLGCVSTGIKTSLDLNVIFNTRERKDHTSARTQVVTFLDSSMEKDVVLPNGRKPGTSIIPVQSLINGSGVYSSGTAGNWASYSRSGMAGHWPREREEPKPTRPWCSAQKFKVTQITEPLFHGCVIHHLDDVTSCKLVQAI